MDVSHSYTCKIKSVQVQQSRKHVILMTQVKLGNNKLMLGIRIYIQEVKIKTEELHYHPMVVSHPYTYMKTNSTQAQNVM